MGEIVRNFSLRLPADGSQDRIALMLMSPDGSTKGSNTRMTLSLAIAAGLPAVQALGPEGALLQQLLRDELAPLHEELRRTRVEVADLRRQLGQVQIGVEKQPEQPPTGQFDSSTVDES